MKRIEGRDLYHCSGKVRIPKKSHTPESDDNDNDDTASARREHAKDDGDSLWQALMAMSKQPQGVSIHEFLEAEKQQTIKTSDLWVPVCTNTVMKLL